MKAYITVAAPSETEEIINKSRFIGRCWPVQEEAEVERILTAIRKQHYDATHNCYAYSLGELGALARFSDDGEPGGTAGLPMMEAVRHKGVTNLLVIVTRYFGGVLLGAGGLVRAYSRSASQAIDRAGLVRVEPGRTLGMELDYSLYGLLEPLARQEGYDLESQFLDRVSLRVKLLDKDVEPFVRKVVELSCGRVTPTEQETCTIRIPVETNC